MFLFLLFFYCFGFQSIMISFEPEIQGKAAHICNIKLSFRFVSSHFALDHIELILKEDRTTYLNTSFGVKLDLLFSYYFESVGWNTEHIILSDVCLWCPASCGLDTYYVLLFYSNRGSGVDSNVQFFYKVEIAVFLTNELPIMTWCLVSDWDYQGISGYALHHGLRGDTRRDQTIQQPEQSSF